MSRKMCLILLEGTLDDVGALLEGDIAWTYLMRNSVADEVNPCVLEPGVPARLQGSLVLVRPRQAMEDVLATACLSLGMNQLLGQGRNQEAF